MQTFLIGDHECTMMPQMTVDDILRFASQKRTCSCCKGSGYHRASISMGPLEFVMVRACDLCEATGMTSYFCLS